MFSQSTISLFPFKIGVGQIVEDNAILNVEQLLRSNGKVIFQLFFDALYLPCLPIKLVFVDLLDRIPGNLKDSRVLLYPSGAGSLRAWIYCSANNLSLRQLDLLSREPLSSQYFIYLELLE